MFDKSEFLEDATESAIPELRYAEGKLVKCEPERQETWILDLKTVIEDRDADGSTPLGIVRVDHRVDQRLANGLGWQNSNDPAALGR